MAKIASTTPVKSIAPSAKTSKNRQTIGSERQEIEKLAYQFFAERGYQHGYDAEDWARAETIVKSRRS
jgi:hypothetical protein